jgi:hypothetical protein
MRNDDDPMRFVLPGDDPELDALLARLQADRGEVVEQAMRVAEAHTAATAKSTAAPRRVERARGMEKEREGSTGVRGRWVSLAALAIVGPIVALALGLLLQRGEKGAAAGASEMAMAREAAVTLSGMAVPREAAALRGRTASSEMGAPSETASGVKSPIAARSDGAKSARAASSSSASAGSSRAKARASSEEDPYAPSPIPARSAEPAREPEGAEETEEKKPGTLSAPDFVDE